MKILPYDKVVLTTNLSPSGVVERLEDNLQPIQPISIKPTKRKNRKLFKGKIANRRFRIRRVLKYKNTFLPEISGDIKEKQEGTDIALKMQPHSFVIAFLILWFGGIGLSAISILISMLIYGNFSIYIMIPFVMLPCGFTLMSMGFHRESRRAKEALVQIFDGQLKEG